MKNKGLLITGIVFLLVGVILFTVGFGGGFGFNIFRLNESLQSHGYGSWGKWNGWGSETSYTKREYTAVSSVERIIIDDKNTPVSLVYTDGAAAVECSERDGEKYEITEDSGTLTIKKSDDGSHRSYPQHTLKVSVPASVKAIDVATSNARVDINNISTGSVTVISSNGAVQAQGIKCDSFEAHTSNAGVELTGLNCNNIAADTSNGRITADTLSCNELSLKSSNAHIAAEKIKVLNSAKLETSNGGIEGSFAGSAADYDASSKTSLGSNNLAGVSGGAIKLIAITSNASIDISFYGE